MNENKLTRKALIFRAIQYAALMIFGPVIKPLRGLFSATGGRDTIAVVTGRDISPATVTAMAGAAIQALGGIDRFVRRGMTKSEKPVPRQAFLPQQFLYFFPLPQGQGSLRPMRASLRT